MASLLAGRYSAPHRSIHVQPFSRHLAESNTTVYPQPCQQIHESSSEHVLFSKRSSAKKRSLGIAVIRGPGFWDRIYFFMFKILHHMCELPESLGDKASYFCQIALVFTTISTLLPPPPSALRTPSEWPYVPFKETKPPRQGHSTLKWDCVVECLEDPSRRWLFQG